MITITKQSDSPLTVKINYIEQLDAEYKVVSLQDTLNFIDNSAEFILNLTKVNEEQHTGEQHTFEYTFYQVFDKFNKDGEVSVQINLKNENGKDITHKASSTFIERPFITN